SILPRTTAQVQSLNKILPADYDRDIRPDDGMRPVDVEISAFIARVDELSTKNMEIRLDMTFREAWSDPRLRRSSNESLIILRRDEDIEKLWIPDTYFVNAHDVVDMDHPFNNRMVTIETTGRVSTSRRFNVRFPCGMDLTHFPSDTPSCSLVVSTYGSNKDDLKLKVTKVAVVEPGTDGPHGFLKDHLSEFDIISAGYDHPEVDVTVDTKNYGYVTIDLHLRRLKGRYITKVYIPSLSFVILAYLTFWMAQSAIVARTILLMGCYGLTCWLSVTAEGDLPRGSFTSSMDVWCGFCLTFIFFALVETLVVHVLQTRQDEQVREFRNPRTDESPIYRVKDESVDLVLGSIIEGDPVLSQVQEELVKSRGTDHTVYVNRGLCETIDKFTRIGYPIAVVVFVVVYAIGYSV
ncbi:unnamed protein product, partial [Cyprideis torosa]